MSKEVLMTMAKPCFTEAVILSTPAFSVMSFYWLDSYPRFTLRYWLQCSPPIVMPYTSVPSMRMLGNARCSWNRILVKPSQMRVRASLQSYSGSLWLTFRTQTPRTQLCMFLQKKKQGQHAELSLSSRNFGHHGIMYRAIWKAKLQT